VSEDAFVAPVDPADIGNVWQMQRQAVTQAAGSTGEPEMGKGEVMIGLAAYKGVCSPGANIDAVWYRVSMAGVCEQMGLLAAYKTEVGFTDAVLQVAATFPMKRMKTNVTYRRLPFDVVEFLSQIERTSAG